jgi:hypothetical protein
MNIQNKIVRLIAFKSYHKHTKSIFKNLNLLNIFQINDFLTSLLIYVSIVPNQKLAGNFLQLFQKFTIIIQEIQRKIPKTYTCSRTNYQKHALPRKAQIFGII